jgi:hypothetical protein
MKLETLGVTKESLAGDWFDYIHPQTNRVVPGVRFKVATLDSDEYRLALSRAVRQHANSALRSNRNKNILPDQEVEDKTEVQALARHVLLDFKGIEDVDGSNVVDREKVLAVTIIREFILSCARRVGTEIADAEEGDLGNSGSGDSGTSGVTIPQG